MPVTIHPDGRDLDVEAIHEAIRARVAARRAATHRPRAEQVDAARAARLEPLDDWDLPRATWAAMYPPNLTPWNLDEPFPIASHRPGVGRLLIVGKRLQAWLLGLLARPILVQQARINRTLALLTRTLADDLAVERLRLAEVERRLARVTGVLRELRGAAEPLVVFADEDRADDDEPR